MLHHVKKVSLQWFSRARVTHLSQSLKAARRGAQRADVRDNVLFARAQQRTARSISHSSVCFAYILAGPRRRKRPPCGRYSRRTSARPNTCRCLALVRHSKYFPPLSTGGWGNDQHRPPSVVASTASSSCSRPSCHLSVVRAPARMRAPLLGQTAVFAVLLALSTCLTGKEMLRRAAAVCAGWWCEDVTEVSLYTRSAHRINDVK